MEAILLILLALIAIPVGVIVVLYLIVPIFRVIGWVIRQIGRFVFGEIGDFFRIIGSLLTAAILVPLVVGNIVIGRWSASAHFGRAIQGEFSTVGASLYRIFIGHPARLLCLTPLTEGIEGRLPAVVAAAPGPDRPGRRVGMFEGYTIVGSLPGGGSGSKLYVAEPDEIKLAGFERQGHPDVGQVVIKVFSVKDGSSIPQIVRESRALDAARKLGLVLEHELSDDRFYYVTRYVPGDSLGLVTQRLHATSGADGLGHAQLREAVGYASDLLHTLRGYHRGGLWHKDVKPDNIIVDGRRAHLVDFGLVTPLRSAMTLTTHGTEYFRDPEMVRLALKGVKVHQVDGAKFDLYAAGAVLFSMIEGSFPAHGGLSQITRRCPEALRWIVRRAMTDYDKRYASADDMLADIAVVTAAADPFAVRPADLPSMRGQPAPAIAAEADDEPAGFRRYAQPVMVGGGSDAPPAAAPAQVGRRRPNIRVARWWTGGYTVDDGAAPAPGRGAVKVFPGVYIAGSMNDALGAVGVRNARRGAPVPPAPPSPPRPPAVRVPAREQVERARARADAARARALQRLGGRRRAVCQNPAGFNGGVAAALFLFLSVCVALAAGVVVSALSKNSMRVVVQNDWSDPASTAMFATGTLPSLPEPPAAPEAPAVASVFAAPMPPAPGEAAGNVLIVGENIAGLGDAGARAVQVAMDRLAGAGFTLVGSFPANPAEGDELEEQLDLVAAATAIRGTAPLDDPGTAEALSDWLASENGVQIMCWITGQKRGDTIEPRFLLLAPSTDPEIEPELTAEAKELFTAALEAISPK